MGILFFSCLFIKSVNYTDKVSHPMIRGILFCPVDLLSPRNALRWGYSNAAVVPCVRPSVPPSVRPSVHGPYLVNTIETTPLHVSLSNLADMLTMMRG